MVGHSLANCRRNLGSKKIDSKAENKSLKEKNSKQLPATQEENSKSKSHSNSALNVNLAPQDPITYDMLNFLVLMTTLLLNFLVLPQNNHWMS